MEFRKSENIVKQIYVQNKHTASVEVKCSYYLDEKREVIRREESYVPTFNHCLYAYMPTFQKDIGCLKL